MKIIRQLDKKYMIAGIFLVLLLGIFLVVRWRSSTSDFSLVETFSIENVENDSEFDFFMGYSSGEWVCDAYGGTEPPPANYPNGAKFLSSTGLELTCCTNKGFVTSDGLVISTGFSLVGQDSISSSHSPWDGISYNLQACQ